MDRLMHSSGKTRDAYNYCYIASCAKIAKEVNLISKSDSRAAATAHIPWFSGLTMGR